MELKAAAEFADKADIAAEKLLAARVSIYAVFMTGSSLKIID